MVIVIGNFSNIVVAFASLFSVLTSGTWNLIFNLIEKNIKMKIQNKYQVENSGQKYQYEN